MFKKFVMLIAILIAILVLIVSFQNLFALPGGLFVLFWAPKVVPTWSIIGGFLAGVIFAFLLSIFFHSDSVVDDGDSGEW